MMGSSKLRDTSAQPHPPVHPAGSRTDPPDLTTAEDQLRQNEYFAALHETALGLISRLDLQDLLKAIVTRAGQLVGTSHGLIYLVDPEQHEIEAKVGVGAFSHFIGLRLGQGEGLAGRVWQTGEPLTVADYDAWSDRSARIPYAQVRGIAGMPLKSGSQVVGVMILGFVEPGRVFGRKELDLLSQFAQLASLALDNARLYTSAQHALAEQHQLADQLAYQAHHDALTGLPNRVLYEDRLERAVTQARQNREMVALFMIDLDRFKRINDTLGHRVGDQLLSDVGRRLQSCLRQTDTVARWGGDEFTMILAGLRTPDDAVRIAEKVLEVVRQPLDIEGHELFVTGSIGMSLYPTDGQDPGELLRHADSALYRAKEQGNIYAFFSAKLVEAASERLKIETKLRGALERRELELHYEPLVDLASDRPIGVAPLLRWNHPDLGVLQPAAFVPIAEESGLIGPIGAWMLEEVCRQTKLWQRSGCPSSLQVAVNIAAMQFRRADFVGSVVQVLKQTGLAAECLELELAESLVMRDVETSIRQITRLRRTGVAVAIDDFGTGYASLSYLPRLQINGLKIAEPFVRGIDAAESTRPLVQAIAAVARSLGIRVTAEGVETRGQLKHLRRVGCARAQGCLFARPSPAKEFEAFLKRSRF